MNQFKKGTTALGLLLGTLFVLIGVLWMALGFWRTLLLAALFGLGYFLGAADNKGELIREAANRVIPKKEVEAIDLRSELVKEQQSRTEKPERNEQEIQEAKEETAEE